MLVAWSLGGVLGPVRAAFLIGEEGNFTRAYTTLGIIALAAVGLTLITKVPLARREAATPAAGTAT